MEEEKKNKLKKILSYIGCGIGCFILGLCVSNCANNKGKKASNVNNNTQNEVVQHIEHKEIQFNDEDEEIIFTAYDSNNCSYPHFADLISSLVGDQYDFENKWNIYVHIMLSDFTFDDLDSNGITFGTEIDEVSYAIAFEYNNVGSPTNYCFTYFFEGDKTLFDFEFALQVDDVYSQVKTAIQQDIEYNNQQYQQSIFGGLTESLVDFIGVIGSGFTSVFTIFYASGHITTFGTLSLIVVGVAIAYFLFRFVIGLIRLRG